MYRDALGGMFASESLRRTHAQISEPRERVLAASLSYAALRKLGLWRYILAKYCRRPVESLPKELHDLLIIGTAGVLELEKFGKGSLVSAVVNRVKRMCTGSQADDSPLANAVLRTIIREAPAHIEELKASSALRDVALARGVPGWAAAAMSTDSGIARAKELLCMMDTQPYLSVRVTKGREDEVMQQLADAGAIAPGSGSSPIDGSVRFSSNPFPPDLPGYADGCIAPMSESSMFAVDVLLSRLNGRRRILDMCTGRGMKAAQMLSRSDGTTIEAWDRSDRRAHASRVEHERMGTSGRVSIKCGDALELVPDHPPEAVLLDAPCSGSGTWRRHPEAKWKMSPEKVSAAAALQARLFERAADILTPGGILMYCTCSLFREENEQAIGTVLSSRGDLAEIPIRSRTDMDISRGRPYGSVIAPSNAWTDGFYIAVFAKKS